MQTLVREKPVVTNAGLRVATSLRAGMTNPAATSAEAMPVTPSSLPPRAAKSPAPLKPVKR
jgi:hypothetical protein